MILALACWLKSLAACGTLHPVRKPSGDREAAWTYSFIHTSFVERENLTLRPHNRRLTRRTNRFSKELSWLERQLWVALA
jgi:IS1 family transposase